MSYFLGGISTSSSSPQDVQRHVSNLAFDTSVRVASMHTAVRRIAKSPHAGHGRPGAFVGEASAGVPVCAPLPFSNAAIRRSNSSTRSGAALIRDHSLHLSRVDRIVGSTAANAGRANSFSPRLVLSAERGGARAAGQHDAAVIEEIAA